MIQPFNSTCVIAVSVASGARYEKVAEAEFCHSYLSNTLAFEHHTLFYYIDGCAIFDDLDQ